MKDKLLNSKLIEQYEKFKDAEITYTIGVDSTFKDVVSYCLVRSIKGDPVDILLTKSIMVKNGESSVQDNFELEVSNLARYFNAKIVRNE